MTNLGKCPFDPSTPGLESPGGQLWAETDSVRFSQGGGVEGFDFSCSNHWARAQPLHKQGCLLCKGHPSTLRETDLRKHWWNFLASKCCQHFSVPKVEVLLCLYQFHLGAGIRLQRPCTLLHGWEPDVGGVYWRRLVIYFPLWLSVELEEDED